MAKFVDWIKKYKWHIIFIVLGVVIVLAIIACTVIGCLSEDTLNIGYKTLWITFLCAVASAGASLLVGLIAFWQNKRMKQLADAKDALTKDENEKQRMQDLFIKTAPKINNIAKYDIRIYNRLYKKEEKLNDPAWLFKSKEPIEFVKIFLNFDLYLKTNEYVDYIKQTRVYHTREEVVSIKEALDSKDDGTPISYVFKNYSGNLVEFNRSITSDGFQLNSFNLAFREGEKNSHEGNCFFENFINSPYPKKMHIYCYAYNISSKIKSKYCLTLMYSIIDKNNIYENNTEGIDYMDLDIEINQKYSTATCLGVEKMNEAEIREIVKKGAYLWTS